MQRSHIAIAGLVTVAAGAAIAFPLVTASADSGSKRETVIVTETSTAFHVVDAPAAPEDGQAGDVGTFESTLAGRKVTGTLAGQCVQLRADGTLDDCSVTVTLGNDSLRLGGLFDPATGGTLVVLGGTGRWVGAGGTDTIVNQPDGTAIHTITVVRP